MDDVWVLYGIFGLVGIVLVIYVFQEAWRFYAYIKEPIKGAVLLGPLVVLDPRPETHRSFPGSWWDWTARLRADRKAVLALQAKIRRDFQAKIMTLGGFDPNTGIAKYVPQATQQVTQLQRFMSVLYKNRNRSLLDMVRMLVYRDDFDDSVSCFVQWGDRTPLNVLGSTNPDIPAELSWPLRGKWTTKLVFARVDPIQQPPVTDFYQKYLNDVKVEGVRWYYLCPFKFEGGVPTAIPSGPPPLLAESVLASADTLRHQERAATLERHLRIQENVIEQARGTNVAQTLREAQMKLTLQFLHLEGKLEGLGGASLGWGQLVVAGIGAVIGLVAASVVAPGDVAAQFLGFIICGGVAAFLAMSGKLPLGGGG